MNYNTQTPLIILGSVSDDDLTVFFEPTQHMLYTADTLKILSGEGVGVVAQVVDTKPNNVDVLSDGTAKSQLNALSQRLNVSFEDLSRRLHAASCKIRMSIVNNEWVPWKGNIPGLYDAIMPVNASEIASHTLSTSQISPICLGTFPHTQQQACIEASLLEGNSLIAYKNSKTKDNLLTLLSQELLSKQARSIIIDPTGSYTTLKNATVCEAGNTLKLPVNNETLSLFTKYVLAEATDRTKEYLYKVINVAEKHMKTGLSISVLIQVTQSELGRVPENRDLAILYHHLVKVENAGLFANTLEDASNIPTILAQAGLAVLDVSKLPINLQQLTTEYFVSESQKLNTGLFIFYDNADSYFNSQLASYLVYKAKNHGINNLIVTSYCNSVPQVAVNNCENYFLLPISNLDSGYDIYTSLKTNHKAINKVLKRMAEKEILLCGDVSNNYPTVICLRKAPQVLASPKHFGIVEKSVANNGNIVYSYGSPSGELVQTQLPQVQQEEPVMPQPFQEAPSIPEQAEQPSLYEEMPPLEEAYPSPPTQQPETTPSMDSFKAVSDDYDLEDDFEDIYGPSEEEPIHQQLQQPEQEQAEFDQIQEHLQQQGFAQEEPQKVFQIEEPAELPPEMPMEPEQVLPEPIPAPPQQPQMVPKPDAVPSQVADIPVYADPMAQEDYIDFQEGDQVHHERYGLGIINRIITTGDKKLCSIQFQEYGRRLLDPKRGLSKVE